MPLTTPTDPLAEAKRIWEERYGTPVAESSVPSSAIAPSAGAQQTIDKYAGMTGATAPAAGTMSNADYQNMLVKQATGGAIARFNQDLGTINNNLTVALSNLTAEKDALAPAYAKQIEGINQNQFNTSEATKEMMNRAGWTGQNSGLAIGEQTKIANAAGKQRADAQQNLVQMMADIQRRMTTAQQVSQNEAAALEKWLSGEISSAEAQALIQADSRAREQAAAAQQQANLDREYNRSVLESDRDYQLRLEAQRLAARRSSSPTAPKPAADVTPTVNTIIADIQSQPTYAARINQYEYALRLYKDFPDVIAALKAKYGKTQADYTDYTKNNYIDW